MLFGAGNFSFISAKTYDLGVKMNSFDDRVLLSMQSKIWLFSLNRKIMFLVFKRSVSMRQFF